MAIQRPFIITDFGAVFPLDCAVVPAMTPVNEFDVLPRDGPAHRQATGLPVRKTAAATVDRIWVGSGWTAS